jgi:hypothetical protein
MSMNQWVCRFMTPPECNLIASPILHWFIECTTLLQSEPDKGTCITHARVLDRRACTALFISDPLQRRPDFRVFLQRTKSTHENTDRMTTADGVLGSG